MTTPSFRDVELLAAYVDGELNPSDSTRLESRLASDPELRAVLDDLRAARGVLRKLPLRRAPRRFTLTPNMAGVKPPLPRAYPVLRFATAMTTLLLVCTVTFNALGALSFGAAAPPPSLYGMGGGGGEPEQALAPEEPAMPSAEIQILPTLEAADSTRSLATSTPEGMAKEPGTDLAQAEPAPAAGSVALLVLVLLLAAGTWLVRFVNDRKWRMKAR